MRRAHSRYDEGRTPRGAAFLVGELSRRARRSPRPVRPR